MIITIQKSTKGYTVTFIDTIIEFEHRSLQQVTKELGQFSDNYFKHTEERPTIKILPIQSKPMATKKEINMKNNPYEFGFMKGYEAGRESYKIQMQLEDVTNYNQPMAMKSRTYPAKKKAVVKKAKKAVKKPAKK